MRALAHCRHATPSAQLDAGRLREQGCGVGGDELVVVVKVRDAQC